MPKTTLIVICFFCSFIYGSANEINGKVNNEKSNTPLPFVNISLKGTYNGTVSDINGNYKLRIPQGKEYTICFSCIGYQTLEIDQIKLQKNPNVKLQKSLVPIDEIVVMPDSTLRSFLRKAYNKIPENYPSYATSYELFHRGGLQNNNKEYFRLNEVLLKAFKSSYKNKTTGTVSIIKTRKYSEPNQSKMFRYAYYGGVHDIHNDDLVKNRKDYLKPHKDYKYELLGMEYYNNRKVYVITFEPKPQKKLRHKGTLYIDVKTLGYLKFEIKPTQQWIRERYNGVLGLHSDIKAQDFDFIVNYNIKDSTFYYQSSYYKEKINHKDSLYFLIGESIVTSMQKDTVQKIPFEQQTPITYVPTLEATEYAQSNWKDYATMPNAIDTVTAKELFNAPAPRPSKKEIVLKFMNKIEANVGLGYHHYSMNSSSIGLSYQHLLFEKEIKNISPAISLGYSYMYKLTQSHGIAYRLNVSLSNANYIRNNSIYYNYRLPIKTIGRNVFANISAGYSWRNFGQSLGTSKSNADFKFGGKKMNADKVKAFTGLKENGWQTGVDFLIQLKALWYLNVGVNYFWANKSQETFYMKEVKGIIRAEANEPLNQDDINYQIDGVNSTSNGVINNNWGVSAGLSMCF